jgi:cytochrome bd-type quinol oxidase subunit 2
MSDLVRLLVVVALVAIVASLGSALFHLSRGDTSGKMVRALTVRIGLSVVLFLLLIGAWYAGFISPHDIQPRKAESSAPAPSR